MAGLEPGSSASFQTSEEDSASNAIGRTGSRACMNNNNSIARRECTGLSLGVARKPRGRPPGSKNKAKPAVIITRDSEDAMRPHILEVAGGHDVVECLTQFCGRRQVGLCVLSGRGMVTNVTIRQPNGSGSTVTFHGRFEILSLSGAYNTPSGSSSSISSGLSISLAGAQGQVVGGSVAGTLRAAGPVIVIVASFTTPSHHNLPQDDQEENGNGNSAAVPPPANVGAPNGYNITPSNSDSCVYTVSPNPISSQLPPDHVLPWPTQASVRPPYSIR